MKERYPVLCNVVHAENHQSIRWLKRCGFEVAEAEPTGWRGAMFHTFQMKGNTQCAA